MTTIIGTHAIAQPLPQVRGALPGPYHVVGSSGHSTSIARPPKTIAEFPANTFQHSLQSPALLQALKVQLNVVETESSHDLASEGDIERAAALYLLHHINRIVEKGLLPVLGIPVDHFYCVGQSTTGTSRPDIKFVVQVKVQNKIENRTVLILEYKRANALREKDWIDKALIKPGRTAQQVIASIKPGERTALLDNAGVISQQASKYSSQCGLVVLSNYQNMIVLDFTPKNAPFDDVNNPVEFFWSSGNSLTHKQLLTAALIYGLRKANIMGQNA